MRRAVALALLALVAAVAAGSVDIELATDSGAGLMVDSESELTATAPVMIPRPGTTAQPQLITAATFKTRGGRAAPIETSTLLIDGKAVTRLVRVEGELAGTNAELNLQLNTVPRAVRVWLKRFLTGKFKRNKISVITRTPGTGTATVPLQYSRFDYTGVLIRELQLPRLGKADGVLKLKLLYQKADETKNVRQRMIAESGSQRLRSEFFKLSLTDADGKSDKQGKKMGKAVFAVEPIKVTRTGGFGKQDVTSVAVKFRAASDKSSALNEFSRWYTQPTLKGKEKGTNPKTRRGALTLYYWSGASMDATAGPDSHGQLKPLLTLQLNDLTVDKLESGDGRAHLKADSVEITKL